MTATSNDNCHKTQGERVQAYLTTGNNLITLVSVIARPGGARRPGTEESRGYRVKRTVAIIAALAGALMFSVSGASADYQSYADYFNGYLAPGQGASTAYDTNTCIAYSGSRASGPAGWYMTVALIDTSGGWRRSARGNGGGVFVYLDPDTVANAISYNKKAHCNNSENGYTFSMECSYEEWVLTGCV